MQNLNIWLWLTVRVGLKRSKIKALLETFENVQNIYNAKPNEFLSLKFLNDEEMVKLSNKSINGIEQFINTLKENNVKIITSDMDEYPNLLKNTEDHPYVLYCRGKFLNLNDYVCVAMVGSRKASEYGLNVAKTLACDVAKSGIIIVSGLAYGIDAQAHSGALCANMPTVAVLGCGINRVYPPSNAHLMKEIMQTGMVISEYPPNTEPLKHHFPERNRIISGICHGTVVVEATFKSGSLITANIAGETGRDVFAVPGNINSLYSKGTNHLLKDGAYVVTCADDIINQYSTRYAYLMPDDEKEEQTNITDLNIDNEENLNLSQNSFLDTSLSKSEQAVMKVLNSEPMHIDKISSLTNIDFSKLSEVLLTLELNGKIYSHAGNCYSLAI